MLYFKTNDNFEIPWHVGQEIPKIWQPQDPEKPRRYVKEIYADGDEMDHIMKLVPGLQELGYFQRRSMTVTGSAALILYALLAMSGPGKK